MLSFSPFIYLYTACILEGFFYFENVTLSHNILFVFVFFFSGGTTETSTIGSTTETSAQAVTTTSTTATAASGLLSIHLCISFLFLKHTNKYTI